MKTKKLSSIRGVYYDPNRGLFLIKTIKSRGNWTTPGGKTCICESHTNFLNRQTFEETGLTPTNIQMPQIIPPYRYENHGTYENVRILVTVYVYAMNLNVPHAERLKGSCLDYAFKDFGELTQESCPLSQTTRNIVSHQGFLKFLESFPQPQGMLVQ